MSTLTDPRAEAFAVARARGANLEDAYDLAGFAGAQGDDFDTPERMRETRETLLELRRMQVELEHQRGLERERSRRTSPRTARTSPKPPVSARISPPAERAALAAPRLAALEFATSPLAIGAARTQVPPPACRAPLLPAQTAIDWGDDA